mgnify:CR=1 FL=1
MAYFSNGSEGETFENMCAACRHDRNKSCRIALAHLVYNYDQLRKGNEDVRRILDMLVHDTKESPYLKCEMFIPLDSAKEV